MGPRAETLAPARGPSGARVTLQVAERGLVTGELLAAEDSSMLLLVGARTLSIPYSRIRNAAFPELQQRYSIENRSVVDAETMNRLRLVSHFPQGLTPRLRAGLATMYKADSVSR